MPRAWSLVRTEPHYRHNAILAGLRAAGFDVQHGRPGSVRQGDVLAIWNRYGDGHAVASSFERAGGRVLVFENGYLGAGGSAPKFDLRAGIQPGTYLALALGAHNGAGAWPSGDGSRWRALNAALRPWRSDGGHVLVCPSRPFGVPGKHMPADWAERAVVRLKAATGREVRLRAHPGNDSPRRALAADLDGCWAVAIWASSAGVHALVAGIPVLCDAPAWICKSASGQLDEVEKPPTPDRLPALERMAWAQWRVEEVETGEPIRHLLRAA